MGRPFRNGIVGFTIGSHNIECLLDERGKKDLYDNELKVTQIGIADELAAASADLLTKAQARAETIAGKVCEIAVPVTEEGALYGSVGTREISEAFASIDTEIDKSEVQLPEGPIKETGDHIITIAVHPEVSVEVTVKVLAE